MAAEISRDSELRKLPVSVTQNIAKLLDGDDSVIALLMGNIVKDLEDPNSELRFTSLDADAIRNHSEKLMKSPVLILLEEWSSMGKVRPKVHHFLALLVKCQLFRAADYVAQLSGEPEPLRPATGAAARVDLALPDDIEMALNGMQYPFSGIDGNLDHPDSNRTIHSPNMNFEASSNMENISIPFIRPPSTAFAESSIFNGPATSKPSSNLIRFSTTVARVKSPAAAAQPAQTSQLLIPALSTLQNSEVTSSTEQNAVQSDNIPALSGLLTDRNLQNSDELPKVVREMTITDQAAASRSTNNVQVSDANIPVFSKLFNGEPPQSFSRTSRQSSASSVDSDDNI